MEKRRELTPEEKQIAYALKSIWDAKKKQLKFSQESASSEMGFSSQSSVSQYLNAKIPLNTDAKIKFAKFLGIAVTDFDPGFDKTHAVPSGAGINRKLATACADLTDDEAEKVKAFVEGLKSARSP